MAHRLPRFEQRPTYGYDLGQTIGRGCLTSSIPINVARLLALAGLVVGVGLLSGGGSGVPAASGLLMFLATWLYRPQRNEPVVPPDTWTPREQRLMRVVQAAEAEGGNIASTIAAGGLAEQLAIDYGTAVADGRPILVSQTLRRAHQLITGGSGSGKSKFIAMQAAQAAVCGSALAVIDPHEELVADILCAAAPILAERGCISIWPGGPTRRIYPWNPLWTGPGRAPWNAADLVVGAVKRVWQLSDANTYILDVLKHTTWALAAAGWTLLEGSRFLTDEQFREYVVEQAAVPQVTTWVRAYNELSPRDRQALIQSTVVRLNRLHGNPHLMRLIGCGVTDRHYRTAMLAAGVQVVEGADLIAAINQGHHLFAVLPVRALGEDQYLVAGLIQGTLLAAALSRAPNDPSVPELELYLDEAAAYANAEGLGKLLAQARKYRVSAMVALQGLYQADPALAEELKTNTAIKTVFQTDHPAEAALGAAMLCSFDPLLIKMDLRQPLAPGDGDQRAHGQIHTYSPNEQQAFAAGQMMALPARHYYLKVRGASATPFRAVTPEYVQRYALAPALRLAMRRRVAPLISAEQIDAELRARAEWLEGGGYLAPGQASAGPAAGGAGQTVSLAAAGNTGARDTRLPEAGLLTIGGLDDESLD